MSRTVTDWRWWFRHECRLVLREAQLGFGSIAMFLSAGVLTAGYLMLHVIAYLFLQYMSESPRDTQDRLNGVLLVLLFSATCVRCISLSHRMLFGLRDVKLLLSSPVRMADLLRARALVLAAASVAFPLLLLSPVANVSFLFGRPGMLALYPMAFSFAVVAALLAVAVVACSRRWLGNVGAQAVARFGVGVMLLLGLASKLPGLSGPMDRVGVHIEDAATWLGTSLMGNLVPVSASLAVSLAGVGLLPRFFAAVYLSGMHKRESGARMQISLIRPDHRPVVSNRFARLLSKDCKLVWRHPAEFAQGGGSALMIAAAVMIMGRHQPLASGQLPLAAVVCALAAFGAEVGWLVTKGEQAPWLLSSAPLSRFALWMLRWLSTLALTAPVLLIVTFGLSFYRPIVAFAALVFGFGALATSLLLATSAPVTGTPVAGALVARRRNWLLSAATMVSYGSWAAAAVTALRGSIRACACLALGALLLAVLAALGFHKQAVCTRRRLPDMA